MRNRSKVYGALVLVLAGGSALASLDDLTARVESNSCRLANAYTLGGKDYSGSAGTTLNGKYDSAEDRKACLKKCEADEKSRREEKPAMYGLRVACYFGNDKVFERTYR